MAEEKRGRGTAKPVYVNGGVKVGQIKPQTPSGEVKRWKSPSKGTTPADRKSDAQ